MGMNSVVEDAELKVEYKKGKKQERQKILELIEEMVTNYWKIACPFCGKTFIRADEAVVNKCPECGTKFTIIVGDLKQKLEGEE